MRLFLAFDVRSKELERLRTLFSFDGIKLAEGSHLTMKFLGEVDEAFVPKIQETLRSVSFEKITVKLDGLGVFPNKNFIRVVWVGLKPEEKVLGLKKQVDDVLSKYFPLDENFKVHVTLGRVKNPSVKDKVLALLKEKVMPEVIVLDTLKLYQSELRRSGPVYTVIEEYTSR